MYLGLNAKRPIYSSDFNNIRFFSTDHHAEVPSNKLNDNLTSSSRFDICGQTDRHYEANRRLLPVNARLKGSAVPIFSVTAVDVL
jgi:hypothetical protein